MPQHSMDNSGNIRVEEICFGLNRQTDERSLAAFIQRFARPELLAVLLPRMADEDITTTVDFLTRLMRKHFSEKEYHQLFLAKSQ